MNRARVQLLARNNEVLAEAYTDREGLAHFDPGLLRGKDGEVQEAEVAVAAERGDGGGGAAALAASTTATW